MTMQTTGEFLGVHHDPKPHTCPVPHDKYALLDTVWRCECGRAYRFEYVGTQYNEDIRMWTRYAAMDRPTEETR